MILGRYSPGRYVEAFCLSVFILGASSPAMAIVCSEDTYTIRLDRWAISSSGSSILPVTFLQWKDLNTLLSGQPEAGSTAHQAIRDAANAWENVDCPDPDGGTSRHPEFELEEENHDYPTAHSGDEFDSGGIIKPVDPKPKEIIYAVDSLAEMPAGAASDTLGITVNQVYATGRSLTSDIVFNHFNKSWRVGSTGCSTVGSGSADCYDLESVAIHEFGHWLGFDHVNCEGAVMFDTGSPTGQPTALSNHEEAAACALYPPRQFFNAASTNASEKTLGDNCTADIDCQALDADGVCLFDGFGGYCSISCNNTGDCPTAYVCDNSFAANGDSGSCRPGPNYASSPGSSSLGDICQSCASGGDCGSGICIDGVGDSKYCSRGCADNDACPSGMSCVSGRCAAPGGNCSALDGVGQPGENEDLRADLNELCFDSNGTVSTTDDFVVACGPGLNCFGFRVTCGGTQLSGACVEYCNAGTPCSNDFQTCCYDVNERGECISEASEEDPHGGCFTIQTEGESCATSEESICEDGLLCQTFGSGAEAMCFRGCPNADECGSGQNCREFSEENCASEPVRLCCNTNDEQNCLPSVGEQKLGLGESCLESDQCSTNLCVQFEEGSVCTRRCEVSASSFGCPADDVDTTGDGKADGGFTCESFEKVGFCYPKAGPLGEVLDVGCGCQESSGVGGLLGCALILLPWLRRRRFRPTSS